VTVVNSERLAPPRLLQPERRYLAAWFPFLPTDRLKRQCLKYRGAARGDARFDGPPLVVVEKESGALRLVAVSREALALGLSPGLGLADARARAPDLTVEENDAHADALLLERLAEDCDRFTPIVVVDAPDGLLLDITGCEHLFGDEMGLRRVLGRRFARAGLQVRLALAGAPDAARALARFSRIAQSPPGDDEQLVRRLPVAALGAPEEARLALARAGLKTIGDLADRPSLPLSARFGADLMRRLRRTLGREAGPVTPRRIVPVCSVDQRFAEPIARSDDIEATLAELVARAADLLMQRREGGRRFEASFFRADGEVRRIAVETGRPAREAAPILRLFRERLETLADPIDPGFGFDLIRLDVPIVEPLSPAQASLDGKTVEADQVAALVDRLATRFGRMRVVRFVPEDTHDPDRAARVVPAVDDRIAGAVWQPPENGEPPARPVQLFDPPQPVMAMAEVPDGAPVSFIWRRRKHEIVYAEGPERIATEWWRKPAGVPTRDYYRVEDKAGRRFWLFRAGLYGRETAKPGWYLHGVFA
jgi:protein ImuB